MVLILETVIAHTAMGGVFLLLFAIETETGIGHLLRDRRVLECANSLEAS